MLVKGGLTTDVEKATTLAQKSYELAKKTKGGVDNLNLSIGHNLVADLTTTVTELEGKLLYLHNLFSESATLMKDIVEGRILIAGHTPGSTTGTAGGVSRAEFDTYKVEQKQEQALLHQDIDGGGTSLYPFFYNVGQVHLYCHLHFPLDSYNCVVGPMGLMGSVTDSIVSQSDADD